MLHDLFPGILWIILIAGCNVIISVNVFWGRIYGHIPAIFFPILIYTFSKITGAEISLHHKIGNCPVKSLFTIFAKTGLYFLQIGENL